MKKIIKLVLITLLGLGTLGVISCEQPPTITANPDLTGVIIGPYSGNYVVNYEAHPQDNFSSQITLVVTRVDKTIIRVDTQGGDSFECSIKGSSSNLHLSNITNTKGAYILADDIDGFFINGTLYYKVTGISNGDDFYAEFTVI